MLNLAQVLSKYSGNIIVNIRQVYPELVTIPSSSPLLLVLLCFCVSGPTARQRAVLLPKQGKRNPPFIDNPSGTQVISRITCLC